MAAAAAAVIGIATPASASVQLTQYNGPDLATSIKASSTNTQNDNTQVYGCTQNNGQCANVLFTGLLADATTGTQIHITDGAGFASITDILAPQNLYNLIINPDQDFNQFMFSLQLINDGTVSVYYTLSSGGGWVLASPTSGYDQKANGNNTYLLQGDLFSAVMVSSTSPIKEYKQNSITLGSIPAPVPEPATWALMLLGFGGMGMALRRSRRRSKQTLMQIA